MTTLTYLVQDGKQLCVIAPEPTDMGRVRFEVNHSILLDKNITPHHIRIEVIKDGSKTDRLIEIVSITKKNHGVLQPFIVLADDPPKPKPSNP